MKKFRENVCGIDIGSRQVFVAVENQPVCAFDTFTGDFKELVKYLKANKVETIAMESTGEYWVILNLMLEEAGFDVWLVDGRQTKQVPGRKTDVKDCQWIKELHSYGLLNRCFIAPEDIQELRSYMRLREDHLRSGAMHINHMQKALIKMNIRLPQVLSEVHGRSGLNIIRAILKGERNPEKLVELCHTSVIKNKREQIIKALEGYYTESGLFELSQALKAYGFYQEQVKACDEKIEKVLKKINRDKDKIKPEIKHKVVRRHKPDVDDLDIHLCTAFEGRDANVLPGITDYTWLELFSELGTDLSRWPSEKHFTSWLCLAPARSRSGKSNRRVKKRGGPRATQIFRQISQSLIHSKTIALGAFGRRIRAKKGPLVAIKAMARKLAILYWRVMQKGMNYVENGVKMYDEKLKDHKKKLLENLAKNMNAKVIFHTT